MPTNAIAVARFSIADSVSAINLWHFTGLMESLYSWHALMDRMDRGPVHNPTAFLPPPDEQLMVSRADIGSPNLIGLLGHAADLIPTIKFLGLAAGVALAPFKFVKWYNDAKAAIINVRKVEEDLERARLENRLVQKSLRQFDTEPDPMPRTMRHRQAFSKDEFNYKELLSRQYTQWARDLIGPFATIKEVIVLGDDDELTPPSTSSASPSSPSSPPST
jgi:hypothetical protein